ncbi:hypothetical protein BDK51DRAFT_32094 [Blyttiomyces helicus]|uniref:Uncharacterized protein n=1 Tax=Blyttiomyces helicus TaxID=388810 RepID=A0A4P9W3D5_9FUNG|nr:hypothetical protein BDK51DRAFT_32093 [Blyttiomyces helicus]RKO86634.1 hypothetical protein BDK51DRAFT_32094 [Blyttiomyces helicus]|eukprot:RKO86632.1 hypothetical protein BDK51DRAFT_32093 [Blyttiomyces helicus]
MLPLRSSRLSLVCPEKASHFRSLRRHENPYAAGAESRDPRRGDVVKPVDVEGANRWRERDGDGIGDELAIFGGGNVFVREAVVKVVLGYVVRFAAGNEVQGRDRRKGREEVGEFHCGRYPQGRETQAGVEGSGGLGIPIDQGKVAEVLRKDFEEGKGIHLEPQAERLKGWGKSAVWNEMLGQMVKAYEGQNKGCNRLAA